MSAITQEMETLDFIADRPARKTASHWAELVEALRKRVHTCQDRLGSSTLPGDLYLETMTLLAEQAATLRLMLAQVAADEGRLQDLQGSVSILETSVRSAEAECAQNQEIFAAMAYLNYPHPDEIRNHYSEVRDREDKGDER